MERKFTLEYWIDDGWYVGRMKEVPGIFSQGETLKELEEKTDDFYGYFNNHYSGHSPTTAERFLRMMRG